MPIDKATFKEAARPLEQRVLDYLQQNAQEAYSFLEIVAALEGYDSEFSAAILMYLDSERRIQRAYEKALLRLMASGKVTRVMRQQTPYYSVWD
jgi:hypothetical protein